LGAKSEREGKENFEETVDYNVIWPVGGGKKLLIDESMGKMIYRI